MPSLHVVRCFVDPDVTHVDSANDPIADIDTIETELMLADLDSLEKRTDGLSRKKAKGSDKDAKEARLTLDLVNRALALLREGKPARFVERKPEEEKVFHTLAADVAAGALRLQRRRGRGVDRQRTVPPGRSSAPRRRARAAW